MNRRHAIALSAAALLLPVLAACGTRAPSDPLQAKASTYGIEILGVQLMADGDLARLDYRVIDFERTKRKLKGEVKILPEGAARSLPVLSAGRLGPMRQRPSASGKRQFMMFTNSGRVLRKGDRAVLQIGEDRLPGIPVS